MGYWESKEEEYQRKIDERDGGMTLFQLAVLSFSVFLVCGIVISQVIMYLQRTGF